MLASASGIFLALPLGELSSERETERAFSLPPSDEGGGFAAGEDGGREPKALPLGELSADRLTEREKEVSATQYRAGLCLSCTCRYFWAAKVPKTAGMEWPRKGDRPSRTLPVAPVICVVVARSARCTFVEQRACSLHCADGAAISQVMTAPRLRRLKEIKMCAHRVWGHCALAERAPSRFW